MSKSNHYRSFVILTIAFLIILALVVLIVKAQTIPASTPCNWSKVASFAGPRSGEYIITDSFTCDHVEWRIRWEVDTTHMHFDVSNYILYVTILPEGTSSDYTDS